MASMPPDTEGELPAGIPPEEETPPGATGHRVAPRRPDGPQLDHVEPPVPPEREHHGG